MSIIDRCIFFCGKFLNLDLFKLKCLYIKWFEMRNIGKLKFILILCDSIVCVISRVVFGSLFR